jgi:CRISPR-associated endonuclease/helicase Cas3
MGCLALVAGISSSFNFSLLSHPNQLLVDHLNGVAEIGANLYGFGEKSEAVCKICMAHDFGKATTFFQKYIKLCGAGDFKAAERIGSIKNHALISAIFAHWLLPEKYKLFGFLAVKKHHGNINDVSDDEFIGREQKENLKIQLNDIKTHAKPELEKIYGVLLDSFFSNFDAEIALINKNKYGFWKNKYALSDAFDLHEVHSYLLSGDKLQLTKTIPKLPIQIPTSCVEKYKNSTRDRLLKEKPTIANSIIFNMREDIFNALKAELECVNLDEESFFSINVPTGSGKTFLAYHAGLYMSNKLNNSSVIYALPFMSIIDQNYDELINIIKTIKSGDISSDVVMKHHSLSEISYNTEAEKYEDFDASFCYDNWQSRIITTTFVQLCNTIFKIGDKSIAHRFNRLVNAVIILDEVQAIDDKFYMALCELFQLLAEKYNTKFIFVTATMPLLNNTHELIPNRRQYFDALNRIAIYNHANEVISFDDFKKLVVEDINKRSNKSFLIVMNTIASSKEMRAYIEANAQREQKEQIYLSTEIYPEARLDAIEKIKIDKSKRLVVVSTQLIEAGVDIDFDIIYRDFAPLSSINQTAGRANRNGLGEEISEVHIYRIMDQKGICFCDKIYKSFTSNVTRDILSNRQVIKENEIFDLNQYYAKCVYDKVSPDKSNKIIEAIKSFDFKVLRDNTNLIDEKLYKYDIIIEADDKCTKLLNDLKALSKNKWDNYFNIQNIHRKLNKYGISISTKSYGLLMGDLKKLEGFEIEYLPLVSSSGGILYSKEFGILP